MLHSKLSFLRMILGMRYLKKRQHWAARDSNVLCGVHQRQGMMELNLTKGLGELDVGCRIQVGPDKFVRQNFTWL